MTKLSVNVNKLATLRNSRDKNNPDLVKTTLEIIGFGAQGITVHPRPDGRHIRREDVYSLAEAIDVELNVEGYPDQAYLSLARDLRPSQCTLVPDPPGVLTSNAGWVIADHLPFLQATIAELRELGIRSSLFLDPKDLTPQALQLLAQTGVDRVELYTEAYAEDFATSRGARTLDNYRLAAAEITALGIGLNAGHDLNLDNLRPFVTAIPAVQEVSIGHALICDALALGLKETVARYLACVSKE